MAKQCEMIIGYLLPRRCEEKGITVCQRCKRTVCELHTRVGDDGLLCRDCFERGQPRTDQAAPPPLPQPVQRTIYRRWEDDFDLFEREEGAGAFSMLS